MKDEGTVRAVLYGHVSGHSRNEIQRNIEKLGVHISAGAISNLVKKHIDSQGRVVKLAAAGKRKPCAKRFKLQPKMRGKLVKHTKKHRGNVVIMP